MVWRVVDDPRESSVTEPEPKGSTPAWLLPIALLLLIAHAINYLYYFVDDEAIVLVFAEQLLAGHGLTYSLVDGPVEGFANLLHILVAAGWLAGVEYAGLAKAWVFAVGSAWSLLAAIGTVTLTARVLGRLGTSPMGAAGGLGFLVLSGPFAVWASTPLETATVSLVFLCLVALLIGPHDEQRMNLAAVTAVVLLLYRLDGFVFVGSALLAAVVFADVRKRRALVGKVIPVVVVAGCCYWAWRFWYFGDVLPMPFYAKIAFKLIPSGAAVAKLPETSYLAGFAATYGYLPLAALLAGWLAFTRDHRLLQVLVTLGLAAIYVQLVGDWMFAFRFTVPLMPLAALLCAATITQLHQRRQAAGAIACAVTLVVSGLAAVRIAQTENLDYSGSWYARPSMDQAPYFGRYHPVVTALRPHVQPGDTIAYNQAGLVPFLLDLNNIDTLGLCSRFYATLPTRDVIFTEVGRFTELTNKPALTAAETYLLHRRPKFIIETSHLLRRANGGVIPGALFGGRYQLAFHASPEAAVYVPTEWDSTKYDDPSLYYENLAHTANIADARVDGVQISPKDLLARLPYVVEEALTLEATDGYAAVLTLPDDSEVSEIYLDRLRTSVPMQAELTLFKQNRIVFSHRTQTEALRSERWHRRLPGPVSVDRAMLTLGGTGGPATIELRDLRVLGQTPTLRAFVNEALGREYD